MFMPTNSSPVASTQAIATPVGAVAPVVASSARAPADFLAMLEQMLQAPAAEAGELSIESVDIESTAAEPVGDTDTDTGELLDSPALADPMLALALLGAPVNLPTPPASPASIAAGPVGVDGGKPLRRDSAVPGGTRHGADATGADVTGAAAMADVAAPARSDSPTAGTVLSTSVQQGPVPGAQVTTMVVTQPTSGNFPATDAPPDPTTQRVVHSSVGTAAWANELGTRLTFMAGQGQHSASLRLSPEHLGPLEVRIDMNDDKASVWFGAQHADTRAALNEALPRLRELFAASGMMLADSGVSQQQAPRQDARDSATLRASTLGGETAPAAGATSVTSITNRGLLDLYA
jgi:flagellar hook-length control protein FliK